MSYLITHAQPPLEFIPPQLHPLVLRGVQLGLPFWLRSQTSITDINADHLEILADFYHQFQSGKIRFLLAFRHPSVDDPYCLAYTIWHLLPKFAKKHNIPLTSPLHAHFIYDRGIPLWAGKWVGWLYSHLGGTPIIRGKLDRTGLRSARDLFVNGKLPIAAAPEGATNGHNEIVSPIEPGISQMGFWCVEDLAKAGRSEQVFIVPIGIKYQYIEAPWNSLDGLLTELEMTTGLKRENLTEALPISVSSGMNDREAELYRRLLKIGSHLLTIMEDFYTKFYHQSFPPASSITTDVNTRLETRLPLLLDVALKVAEEYFGLGAKGTFIDRCRRLEQAGWERIYREDLKSLETLSPLERGLADRIAEESSLRMWHMRLVESFVAVTGQHIREKPTAERFAETSLLLWDVLTRIKGGSPFTRPVLGKQRVKMTVGEPISVSERGDQYQSSRRQAVNDLTKDLQIALEKLTSD